MKYALFLYDDETFQTLPEDDQMAIVAEHGAYVAALEAAKVMVFGEPLDHSSAGRTLRANGTVEDGPYADTKEQLGGLYIIEVDTIEEAVEWAKKCPTHRLGGHVEVRPVPVYGDG